MGWRFMKPYWVFALFACVALFAAVAMSLPHECRYSSVDPRLENAKLQADFDVHRASIESRVALEQLRVAQKVASRLYSQHLLNADEYNARLKEISDQEHAVRMQMLKSKIAALESVLGVSSNDAESLGKLRKLRVDLQSEERAAANSCNGGSSGRSVAD